MKRNKHRRKSSLCAMSSLAHPAAGLCEVPAHKRQKIVHDDFFNGGEKGQLYFWA